MSPGRETSVDTEFKVEDMAIQIKALREVNGHLDTQVKTLTQDRDTLREEKKALEERLHKLGATLKSERELAAARTDADTRGEASPSGMATIVAEESIESRQGKEAVSSSNNMTGNKNWDKLPGLRAMGLAAGWLVESHDVQFGAQFASGSSGDVYKGKVHGADVAVKRVRIDSDDSIVAFLREVEVASKLRSPNIVPFIGAALEPNKGCLVITEYMPGGNLKTWLHKNRKTPSFSERLTMGLQVAKALNALEDSIPSVIHRDVKPSNILIGSAGEARLADFSLARLLPASSSNACMTGETGTYIYMAPEVIRHENYGKSADVYSFGVLLIELITAELPYADRYFTPIQVAGGVCKDNLRPTIPQDVHAELASICTRCWDADPAKRPSFKELVASLESIVPAIIAGQSKPTGIIGFLSRPLSRECW